MHTGPIDTVIFVHGYSVRDLNSFNKLPALLQADGIAATSIYLAGFVSLDDYLGCDDLADALERRIASLIAEHGIDLGRTMLVAHSTGALVARRWILNRRATKKAVAETATLSHFVSCAGANHGSTMAQLGRTELAYLFRTLTQGQSVGKRVLEDLDYGSDFLLQLNREWLDAWNDAAEPLYAETFASAWVAAITPSGRII
ncbi:MAG TPA: alpha/beta fold hydrolase [Candidatus Tumulicola sp.]|jgi:triacylglycerol esterase/lipase EstA (alpha/beta hydrolase family)